MACDLTSGRRPLPGGRLYATDAWVVEHCVGPLGLGTLIVKPLRHVTSVAELSTVEAIELGPLLRQAAQVATAITEPEQVYNCLWSHADGRPGHIHYVVQPVSREQREAYGSVGPDLQRELLRRSALPDAVALAKVCNSARRRFAAELRTERLTLRQPTPDDVSALLAIHRDPRATAYNPSEALRTTADARRIYDQWDLHWQQHGFGYWVVRNREEAAPIGFCGVKAMTLDDRVVLNLFYRFAPDQWGHGYATEAARRVVQWAGALRPRDSLIARVRPENVSSQRVAANVGLTRISTADGEDGPDWIFAAC